MDVIGIPAVGAEFLAIQIIDMGANEVLEHLVLVGADDANSGKAPRCC